jgi:hypothetical protein
LARKPTLPEGVIDRNPKSVQGKNNVLIIKSCIVCSQEYGVAHKVANRYQTCSSACSSVLKSRNKSWLAEIDRTCSECGIAFIRKADKAGLISQYCSDICRLTALNNIPRPPAHTVTCETCGVLFRSQIKAPRKFCTRECMWENAAYRKRRNVRNSPTRIEQWLFGSLDGAGIAYERYHQVGRFSVDCYIPSLNLLIEVDGFR